MAFPTISSAYGVWSLKEQRDAVRGNNWPILTESFTADLLVAAGGGGGGYRHAGGGGGGGLLIGSSVSLEKSIEYSIVVGAGGSAGESEVLLPRGGDSVFGNSLSAFGVATAFGGGSGGTERSRTVSPGGSGGSGGGGGGANISYAVGGSSFQNNSAGLTGYGNAGGFATGAALPYNGGGGGGAGAAGTNGVTSTNRSYGGDGVANSITGNSTYYCGGGGGGGYDAAGGNGGLGGGGDGASNNIPGGDTPGDANTGGGGGGGMYQLGGGSAADNTGGSGVVIIRTLDTAVSTTGSPTVTTDGSHNIYTFTGSGSIKF